MTEPIPPGETIQEELDARGWSRDDLAGKMGVPVAVVNRLADGSAALSPTAACLLTRAFPGTHVKLWLRLEASYRKALAERPPK